MNTKSEERKKYTRNRLSLILTLISLYFTNQSIDLSPKELLLIENKELFKSFIYSSVISSIIFIYALLNKISKYYYINLFMVIRLAYSMKEFFII